MDRSKDLDENVAGKIEIKCSLPSDDEEEYSFQPKRKQAKLERDAFDDSQAECCSKRGVDQNEYYIKRESDKNDLSVDEEENRSYENHDNVVVLEGEQVRVYEYVENLVKCKTFRENNSKIILVEGPAGTGKTEVLKALREFDCQVIYTASTGVTAQNYEGGRTAHSMFGFPFDIDCDNIQKCNINDYNEQVSNASIIVYDAVNMADKRLIEILNASLKELMGNNEPFGGKIMVFGADFMEVGPIVRDESDPNKFSVKFSNLLDTCNIKNFVFKKPFRTRKNAGHFEFLLKVGNDDLTSIKIISNFHDNCIEYVPLEDIQYSTDIYDIIDFVYPAENFNDSDLCAKRAILAPTRQRAETINEIIAKNMVLKKTVTCKSEDTIINYKLCNNYLTKIASLPEHKLIEEKILPDHDLVLWKGCICMVIRTMYIPSTLLVGAKVIIVDIQDDIIFVRKPGEIKPIPIKKQTFTGTKNGMKFKRKQFPLMLCYATTINRSQGQTLEKVGVDLTEHVFTHGQLYLALSRVRCSDDLKVCIQKEQVIHGIPYTRNIVDRRLVEPT